MRYLQPSEIQILRSAPSAEYLFPRLGPDEFVVLDADMGHHHAYIECQHQDEARRAIQETLFTTLSQTFFIAKRI